LYGGVGVVTSAVVDSARLDWEEGRRRFEVEASSSEHAESLHRQVEAVADELRRRLGSQFTLAELADTYLGAERWVRAVVDERAPARRSELTLTLVTDAAFQRASADASDFIP
jgi:hypothetical protein